MSAPLSSSDQSKIQSVEHSINECIAQSQSGQLNLNELTKLQKQLAQLMENPNIPDSVRKSLQMAINDLKQVKSGSAGNLANLTSAKLQLDQVLGGAEAGGMEGEKGPSGGSLGGGSEE